MIKIENVEVYGWESAIRGCRNPKNSWDRMDSYQDTTCYRIGPNDHNLMMRLAKAGSEHAKYRRMIEVWCDVTCPSYVAAEVDTYKVGTVRNSCSLQHKGASRDFTLDDFTFDPAIKKEDMQEAIDKVNAYRRLYVDTKDYTYFLAMRQIMPMGYNYRFTFHTNYETLSNIYRQRKNHKLPEWREFCQWIKTLPYSEIITLEEE